MNLATVLHQRGESGEAQRLCARAMRLLEGAVTADHPARQACADLLALLQPER